MQGKAKCTIRDESVRIHEFNNISLTYISSEKLAIISRNGKNPREILSLQAAGVDVLSSGEIEVEGFFCQDEEKKIYRKCRFLFLGNVVREKGAS